MTWLILLHTGLKFHFCIFVCLIAIFKHLNLLQCNDICVIQISKQEIWMEKDEQDGHNQ